MRSFLKSIFKPSPSSNRSTRPRKRSRESPFTTRYYSEYNPQPEDLGTLPDALQGQLMIDNNEETESTIPRLLRVLEDRGQSGEEGMITPYLHEGRNYRTGDTITTSSLSINERVGLVEAVLQANDEAVNDLEKLLQTAFGMAPNSRLLGQMMNLLETQRYEINEMKPYIESRPFPSLLTLQQIYAKVDGEINNLADLPDTVARDTLVTLVQVLQEGESL